MSRYFPPLPNPENEDFDLVSSLTSGVYLPLDGSEAMQGDLDMGGGDIYMSDLGFAPQIVWNNSGSGSGGEYDKARIYGTTGGIVVSSSYVSTGFRSELKVTEGDVTVDSPDSQGTMGFVYDGVGGANLRLTEADLEVLTAGRQILADDGSAAAPGIAVYGDIDTGIRGDTATGDVLAVVAGGTDMMVFTESTTDEIDSKVQHKFSGGFYGKSVDWDGDTAPDLKLAPNRYTALDGNSDYWTSDSGTNTVTGDLTIIAIGNNADGAGFDTIANHWLATGNQRGYNFRMSNGSLILQWSPDGTNASAITATSTAAVDELSSDTTIALKVTLDVNNGAGGNDVKFYKSTDFVNWTQVGSTVTTASTTSIHASTTNLIIGYQEDFGRWWEGNIHGVWVYSGLDPTTWTQVAAFEPMNWPVGGDGIEDRVGLTWTAAGTAAIAGGDTGLYVSSDSDAIQAPVIHYAAPVVYEWYESATAATASFADVIDHTISLPFSSAVWNVELSYGAEGTDMGEAESIEIQSVVISDGSTYTSPRSPGVGNPNGTSSLHGHTINWALNTLDVDGSGFIAATSGGAVTAAHGTTRHTITGTPNITADTTTAAVTIADIPYAVSDEWNLIRFPIVGNDLRVKAQIKGTSYTGTPNVRLTVKAWRVG